MLKYFGIRLFFLTIPKPLKQYTLFKKDNPFRSLAPDPRSLTPVFI
jgi:hypothetical protein